MITLEHYLFLGAIIFTLGVLGIFLNKKNLIIILMSIEPVSYTHLTLPTTPYV